MTDIDLLVRGGVLYPMTEGSPVIAGGEVRDPGRRLLYAGPAQPAGHWQAHGEPSTGLVASCCPDSSTVTATPPL